MPSARHSAVFFDVGGTLCCTEPSGDAIWADALEEHGYHVTRQDVVRSTGAAGPEINRMDIIRVLQGVWEGHTEDLPRTREEEKAFFRRFDAMVLERLGIPAQAAILDTVSRRFEEDPVTHAYEDAEPTLQALRAAGYRLGVISNASHDLPNRLEGLGLARYFDAITYSFEVGVEKPHPEIFLTALEQLGIEAQQAFHVGDTYEADVLGARRAGMTPMLISRDGSHRVENCIVLRRLNEVLDHL